MAGEKNFENRLKRWLEGEGIYPLGHPADKMPVAPYGYYEKRWGGGRYQKSGLPDMRIVVNGLALAVELKATNGTPSELQKHNIRQINRSMGLGFVLYPEGFPEFQKIVKVVKTCPPNVPIAELIASVHALSSINCDTLTAYTRSRTLTPPTP